MVVHGSTYWLFPSKSGGYWHSEDMNEWTFVAPTGLPIETYAPMVVVLGDGFWYWTAFNAKAIFRTADPKTGNWTRVADLNAYPDPGMLVDDDGRVFMYSGCSDDGPISAVELNSSTWREHGAPVVALRPNSSVRGFEQGGDNNELPGKTPFVEGAWMTKLGGRYYLQYAVPARSSSRTRTASTWARPPPAPSASHRARPSLTSRPASPPALATRRPTRNPAAAATSGT